MRLRNPSPRRVAFTLIELLTVIAIISLLIAILVPALSRAREQAKNTQTRGTMKAMGDGLEMFRNENQSEVRGEAYPSSRAADDPTESGEQMIFGAQWAVRYLLGKDLHGYVTRKNVTPDLLPGGSKFGGVNFEQKGWYDDPNISRVGPYIASEGVRLRQPIELDGAQDMLSSVPKTDAKSFEQPVILDSFDTPILYYAANVRLSSRPNAPIADKGGPSGDPYGSPEWAGIYTHADNAMFTGRCDGSPSTGGTCDVIPWDYGGGEEHGIKYFGTYDPNDSKTAGDAKNFRTFTFFILDRSAFEATKSGSTAAKKPTAVPVRRESFILISAGKDGLYGTSDDVTNF